MSRRRRAERDTGERNGWARAAQAALLVLATALPAGAGATILSGMLSPVAASCSTSAPASGCSLSTSIVVTSGTVSLLSSSSLQWSFVLDGYDQWSSASASALSSCGGSSTGTVCGGGSAPLLEVVDSTGTRSGWAVTAYLSGQSDLPAGTALVFDGAGSSIVGDSVVSPLTVDPFSPTTPATVCDFQAAGCTPASPPAPPATCGHVGLGVSACPSYPVDLLSGTGISQQVDLYSATSGTGVGAICFLQGSPTSTGCRGATPTDFYNLGLPASVSSAANLTATVNLTASSGP